MHTHTAHDMFAPQALINNRYRVLHKLGEGGMGRVYLVADELHVGRRVALKAMRPDRDSAEFAGFFSHEFEALTKLRHPNLAEVYDFGRIEHAGHFFFTMEYVTGDNLFEATQGVDLQLLLDYLVQVCRGLEYTHSRGLIHNDIKPENILVVEYEHGVGQVKLMDFGLAREEELAVVTGSLRGTLQYLAPEVSQSRPYDRRADMYSLGVVLYRLLRPTMPVGALDPTEDRLYDFTVPPAPDLDTADLDPRFRSLLRRLITSDPAGRFHSANDVIEEINVLFGTDFDRQTLESKVGYILSGKFVGRTRELSALSGILGTLQAGQGRPLILLGGPAGIGKRRLLREWQISCQLGGVCYAQARCYEHLQVPYGPVVEWLRQVVSLVGPDSDWVDRYRSFLGRLIPELSVGIPGQATADTDGVRLIDNLSRFLIQVTAYRPVALAVVDLQWADEQSLQLVSHLTRMLCTLSTQGGGPDGSGVHPGLEPSVNQPQCPGLALIGTYRDDEPVTNGLEELLELKPERGLEQWKLGRLSVDEVRELVGSMLGSAYPPNAVAQRLTDETDGNPYYIEQLLKSLVEENQLEVAGGWNHSIDMTRLELPSSCDQLIGQRLERIDASTRRVLEVMAVIGRPATLGLIQMVELPEWSPFPGVRELERLHLISRERFEEGSRYGLKQIGFQRLVLQEMSEQRRRELHRQVADALELRYAGRLELVMAQLAHHHIRGGDPAKAIRYGMQAAADSAELHAHQQAIALYQEILPLLTVEQHWASRNEVICSLGDLHRSTGLYDAARRYYEQALGGATEPEQRAALLRRIGETAARQGRYDETIVFYDRVGAELRSVEGSTALRAQLQVSYGRIHELMGEYQAGLQRAEKALALDPPEDVKVTAYQLLGNLCWCVGRYQEAIRHHERSLEIELRRDNSYGLAACYNNLALVSQDLGQIERALDLYHHSLDQWDKYGDPRGRARCMANLGILYMERGDYRRSAEYQQEALATFERLGDLNGIGWVRECLGEVCGALGKWVASEAYYRGSLEICERSGNIPLSIYAYLNLGETYHTFCATESALECAEEGGARAAKIGNDFLICAANLLRGQIKIRLGCMSEAAQLLEQARCRLGELGNRPEAVKAMTQIARLHHANADYGEALEVAQASLTEACEFGQRELMADLHHLMGQIHHEEGRLGLAREELDRASEIASELGRQEMLWAIHHDSGRLHCVTGDLNRARDELLAAVEVGKLTWEALPEALQKTYLEDSRHQLLKGDISHLKNCMLGRSEHVR